MAGGISLSSEWNGERGVATSGPCLMSPIMMIGCYKKSRAQGEADGEAFDKNDFSRLVFGRLTMDDETYNEVVGL